MFIQIVAFSLSILGLDSFTRALFTCKSPHFTGKAVGNWLSGGPAPDYIPRTSKSGPKEGPTSPSPTSPTPLPYAVALKVKQPPTSYMLETYRIISLGLIGKQMFVLQQAYKYSNNL